MTCVRMGLITVALALGAHAETFTVDPAHADISFTVKHLMLSDVKGSFNSFEGTINYDLAQKSLVSMQGKIDTTSIDTNNDKRDADLKSAHFFNTEQYPEMAFRSTEIKKTGDNTYDVTGMLDVLGIERELVLPVTVIGPIDDPWGNQRIGLSCNTELNRRYLNITNAPATVISDEVAVSISAEASLQKTDQ